MNITDRISLLEHVAAESPNGVVVEIGVASGCFTEQILATWPTCSKIIAVDCWADFEGNHLTAAEQEERFQQVSHKFSGRPNVKIVRAYSKMAAMLVPVRSVDFIYVDGDHSRQGALTDLEAWFPKLKPGGIMAGHDYYDGCGVKEAVDEFAAEKKLAVGVTTAEFSRESAVYGPGWEGPSFWFRRP